MSQILKSMDCVTVYIAIILSSAPRVKQEAKDAYLQNLEMHMAVTLFMDCLLNSKITVIGRWIPLLLGLFGVCASDTAEPLPGQARQDFAM